MLLFQAHSSLSAHLLLFILLILLHTEFSGVLIRGQGKKNVLLQQGWIMDCGSIKQGLYEGS